MRALRSLCLLAVPVTILFSCRSGRSIQGDDGKIDITLVQVNDVYEIAPLEGGKTGGLARLSTLKKEELARNPNTFLVMSGDFLSPSVYGSLSYNGKRIRGAQMVDAMNATGFDLVGFGNHEFDISEKELQERIDESKFQWIASNAFHLVNKTPVPFEHSTKEPFPKYYFKTVKDADGTTARLGFISVVLPSNPAEYVQYTDPVTTAIQTYRMIKDSCDAVVAITHMSVKDDQRMADSIPGLAAILGGHEHDMRFVKQNGVYITKAHANAKSAYIVKLHIDKNKHEVNAPKPELVYLDEHVQLDSATNITVQKWVQIANANYATSGFNANAVLPYTGAPLEGRETYIRREQTNLSKIIADAMLFAAPQADASIYNAGSIRVDDVLNPPITQYDILRTLPFGGGLRELDIKGDLLVQTLEAGLKNKGIGGWLQYANISYDSSRNVWSVKGQPVDKNKIYRIVTSDFLITGKEANLAFFNEKSAGVVKMYPARTGTGDLQSDVRLAVIRYLEQKK